MNMRLINTAINAYRDRLDDTDIARLEFFQGIWGVLDKCMAAYGDAYEVPDGKLLRAAVDVGMPIFATAPVAIEREGLVRDIQSIATCAMTTTELEPGVEDDLRRVNWGRIIFASDLELAGANPGAFIMDVMAVLSDDGMRPNSLGIALMAVTLALRAQLEKPAARTLAALRKACHFEDIHPLTCPVCGTVPALAHVGGETSSQGRGRKLICTQCGSAWEFERVRCARCGTQNQRNLHFFNIEGDDSHRIATCDECGGYMRTLFSEDVLVPTSYEVEDVVMAKLDAIAANPAFAAHNERSDR